MKPYADSYNLMQYIPIGEYISYEELSRKTNTNINTLRKQVSKARNTLKGTGYQLKYSKMGIKLIAGDSEYLPADVVLFNTPEFDFMEIFIHFIISGFEDDNLINRMYKEKYYTMRRVQYFFSNVLNTNISKFKEMTNFEYFSLFVEYCFVWFSCRNVSKLYNEYISIEMFNKELLSYEGHHRISANDYMIIYSILVFEKINIKDISDEYDLILKYIHEKKYLEAINYYKEVVVFTQVSFPTEAIYSHYNRLAGLTEEHVNLDQHYKQLDTIGYELEKLQYENIHTIVSTKSFNLTLVYEGTEAHLAMIKGTLRKNYPNISIRCIPSWLYLYGNKKIDGMTLSNDFISENVPTIKARDENGNYQF
ncbi:hypothetical protein RZE82_08735 [Mollicutes bacterium LVI A0039]|nr:hypothetical protein RZE82_08735 [Mollicutes bacterium LVI A0039]